MGISTPRHPDDRSPSSALASIPDDDITAIQDALTNIEADYDVKVLAARDVGSHAWNLNSDTSDYDVAVVFRQPTAAYYQLGTEYATLEQELNYDVAASDQDVEFKAWNITKFSELVNESNASALRFLASPIRYLHEEHPCIHELENVALESFRPGALIGHAYGQAGRMYRDNFVQRLRHTPTEHKTDTRHEQFEVLPESADSAGSITARSITDDHTETIHLSEVGPGEKWGLVKRDHVQKDTWEIVETDRSEDLLVVEHADSGKQRELSYTTVDEGTADEWEWASTDRRVKRFVYVTRSILTAAYVAGSTIVAEPQYPPTDFMALIRVYENLPEDAQVVDLPVDAIKEYAKQKRAATGDEYLDEWHADTIETALNELESVVHDDQFHQQHIDREAVNEILESAL
ncbi:DNA polymerase beta superfamily protein [Salinibaculum rarum]|uniref:DNA polymerase beta superfamily protein n=1 Tax=Salinibaculum rarum TaxID=3058903 RepID=UPI00265E9756|nr:nucleotidyltransferase domain-containing protein [Salinibaculum sp. KK48]